MQDNTLPAIHPSYTIIQYLGGNGSANTLTQI